MYCYWEGPDFVLEEFVRRQRVRAAPLVTQLLDAFSEPRTAAASVRRVLPPRLSSEAADAIRLLKRRKFLVPAGTRSPRLGAARLWRGSFAAAYYHFATRDVRYAIGSQERLRVSSELLAESPQPPLFKEYPQADFVRFPRRGRDSGRFAPGRALRTRRTIREFTRTAVPLATLVEVVQGTWGMTGYLDGGVFGRLLAKTSPSAGARHSIECYVIAWRVRGLAPGLYHYNVRRNGLERLRGGDLRDSAVEAASGQEWVSEAAFLVVQTAVADRVFWKYGSSDAYRLFFLDAGHLAQTFSLVAVEAGLGPFTTAAIQETKIEESSVSTASKSFPSICAARGFRRSPLEAGPCETSNGTT